jgi:hypothetical protein
MYYPYTHKQDFQKQLYETYYINFIHSIPRDLLEELATNAAKFGVAANIAQVYDQYLDFLCLESNLFSLDMSQTYFQLNNRLAEASQVEDIADNIASALLSVTSTLNTIPVLKFQKGNAAELVAKKLESKLKNYYMNTKNDPGSQLNAATYPVLLLLDRNMDLNSMLAHTWTYTAMIHDILGLHLNRITIQVQKTFTLTNK